ncbi:ROK family protein [Ciceribacter thiooxidans]|uniref:ROK family protein n=1 Tax=Ciceribacter thiooxidans TaxID=1969821 RepID=A0ABV7I4U1_9HYPH|nr:ROK family protein [Ciceribacter thiooxidans]
MVKKQAAAGPEAARSDGTLHRREDRPTHVVGIDLGGTKILAGIADHQGTILATINEPTRHGPDAPVLAQLADVVHRLAAEIGVALDRIAHVQVGVPSAVSPATDLASLSPNLALPEDRPLAAMIASRLPSPVTVDNDVNLAAFAEAGRGAGKDKGSLAFISFGTGVGMGLVVSGEIVRGEHGRAGEIALLPFGVDVHTRAPSTENGLFEDAVGTPGIRKRFHLGETTVAELFEKAMSGDQEARAAIDAVARDASVGVASVFSLIDPAVAVIGGGIGSHPLFFESLKRHLMPLLPFPCPLEPSSFGPRAGMIGAVALALRHARAAS